jgi:hypothetical protein
MKLFTASDWYWRVAGDQTKVYSSRVGDYVAATDPTFIAWGADGTQPVSIESEIALGTVLNTFNMRPASGTALDAFLVARVGDAFVTVALKILFNHENRIRTLEGKASITPTQFLTAIKSLV